MGHPLQYLEWPLDEKNRHVAILNEQFAVLTILP